VKLSKKYQKSCTPQMYMDFDDEYRQNLLGIRTFFDLTVSTKICVIGSILIIPEVVFETITAGVVIGFRFHVMEERRILENS